MADIKYIGLEGLREPEKQDLYNVLNAYVPKYERKLTRPLLTVSVKKTHALGTVGRFLISFIIESQQGKFYTEQSGWGMVKTTRRCGEHMQNLLDHRVRKEISEKVPKGQRTKK